MSERDVVIATVAAYLAGRAPGHPLRVGVDGRGGSGKTTLAVELVRAVAARGRPAIHVSSDGFHQRRGIRYRQGRASAVGYYEDAFDYAAIENELLRPLGPGGSRRYAMAVHDTQSDKQEAVYATAPENAVIVFDGTFIQRADLRAHWDEVVYADVARDVALRRGVERDAAALGGHDAAVAAYEERYAPAFDLYVE